jgi:hypothetical protein
VLDDLGRELVTRIGDRLHRAALPRIAPTRPPCRDNAAQSKRRSHRPRGAEQRLLGLVHDRCMMREAHQSLWAAVPFSLDELAAWAYQDET